MSWTLTHSGQVMDLLDPKPHMIELDDIAVQLSRLARFNGATQEFYSVADHSIFVSQIVADLGGDLMAQKAALFHDAHEAYIGDIPTPVKVALGAKTGVKIERLKALLDVAVYEKFDIFRTPKGRALIRRADVIALATERQRFMPAGGPDWRLDEEPSTLPLRLSYSPENGAHYFRRYAWQLAAAQRGVAPVIQELGVGV